MLAIGESKVRRTAGRLGPMVDMIALQGTHVFSPNLLPNSRPIVRLLAGRFSFGQLPKPHPIIVSAGNVHLRGGDPESTKDHWIARSQIIHKTWRGEYTISWGTHHTKANSRNRIGWLPECQFVRWLHHRQGQGEQTPTPAQQTGPTSSALAIISLYGIGTVLA